MDMNMSTPTSPLLWSYWLHTSIFGIAVWQIVPKDQITVGVEKADDIAIKLVHFTQDTSQSDSSMTKMIGEVQGYKKHFLTYNGWECIRKDDIPLHVLGTYDD